MSFTYTISNNEATITGYDGQPPTNLVIPETLGGYPVTVIGDFAFSHNQLTSVTIPNSVTAIGVWAFAENKLTSVVIPSSVTTIGDSAFRYSQLTSVTIPNSVTTIGVWAFRDNELTSVTIPNSVTAIGNWAFEHNQLTSVIILNPTTDIEFEAFAYNQDDPADLTIHGHDSSTAKDYALANGHTFKVLTGVGVINIPIVPIDSVPLKDSALRIYLGDGIIGAILYDIEGGDTDV